MDQTGLALSNDLVGLLDSLKNEALKVIEVPKFRIPFWPKGLMCISDLGKRGYRVPSEDSNGLLSWKKGKHKISFVVGVDGEIRFEFRGMFKQWRKFPVFSSVQVSDGYRGYYDSPVYQASSDHDSSNISRLGALELFDQFKVEILSLALETIRTSEHKEGAESVKKAFEPFVPFVVADMLLK